jgi:2-enoate reductase
MWCEKGKGDFMASLMSRFNLAGVDIRNRTCVCPMGDPVADAAGEMSERETRYFLERARGGFGLIFTGANYVVRDYEVPESNILDSWHHSKVLSYMVDQLHREGAKVCIQLTLGLGRVNFTSPYDPPKSSSNTKSFWFPDLECIPFTTDEIKHMIERFGYSAFLAKNAGADMVEMHAYGGYLIDQFTSKLWNTRTDEYGGSLENRMRLIFELRESVWNHCGKDFPLVIKFTPDHAYPGYRDLDEGMGMLKLLDDGGFAMLHLDKGVYECWHEAIPSAYQEEGLQLYQAIAAKEAGIKTPLMVQGKLDNPKLAEKVISEGIADMVGLGHGSLADPWWPNKVKNKKYYDITPCIGCNECIRSIYSGAELFCAVNPRNAFEREYELTPTTEQGRILVVGGGPGGMMAAITAAQRGYEDIELWEKDHELGGALRAGSAPSFKFQTARYMEYLKRQVAKYNIKVKLNKEATADDILAANPDAVIIAVGATPIVPNLPGSKENHVIESCDLLTNRLETGSKVVVLGGGAVGIETALMLDKQGKDVTVVEMLDEVLTKAKESPNQRFAVLAEIKKSNIKVMTGTTLTQVDKNKVLVTASSSGSEEEIPCDTLVIAVGFKTDNSLREALEDKIKKVYVIGDNRNPAKVKEAVHDGYHVARLLDTDLYL